MLKILSSHEIHALDRHTIHEQGIASIDLMERACLAFVEWFTQHYRPGKKIVIVCGIGNNGGDGLGIARLLSQEGYFVKVVIAKHSGVPTPDFEKNRSRLPERLSCTEWNGTIDTSAFAEMDILIDALLGSGLSRPLEGFLATVVQAMNEASAIKIAVDIPSGLLMDRPSEGVVFKAHRTVSFQLPKLAMLLPAHSDYVGEWSLVDIGLSASFQASIPCQHFFVTESDIAALLHPRKRFSHKGTYGHALVIAGSRGMMGASVLSARAALRAGVGLVTVHIPVDERHIIQVAVPEALCDLDEQDCFSSLSTVEKYTAIAVGPGLGRKPETVKALAQLLENYRKPLVIDADALNILAEHTHLVHLIPPGSILTPHPKEFERLVGSWKDDFDRLEKQKRLSEKLQSVIILKGAFTSIATSDGKVYFNPTGNPGMATGGSGDVLTGILAALLAQGYASVDAALVSVYIHGLAGDLAARDLGMISLMANDLITFTPKAFQKIRKEI